MEFAKIQELGILELLVHKLLNRGRSMVVSGERNIAARGGFPDTCYG